jgi:hypothetical protein
MIISDHCDPENERLACRCGATLYVCKGPAYSIDCRSILQSLTTHDRYEQ